MKNLDLLAARTAQAIIEDTNQQPAANVENIVTKTLGVLQENGVYAALLYLYSRNETEKPVAKEAREKLLSMLTDLSMPMLQDNCASSALKYITGNICNDLDKLLLVKQLWEQTLIYARYGAKARSATAGE